MTVKTPLENIMEQSMGDVVAGNIPPEYLAAMNEAMSNYLESHLTSLWKLPNCKCHYCSLNPQSRQTFRDVYYILSGMISILRENPIFITTGWLDELNFLMTTALIIHNNSLTDKGPYDGKRH